MALPPAVFEMKSYDWIINLCVGKNGPLAYVARTVVGLQGDTPVLRGAAKAECKT